MSRSVITVRNVNFPSSQRSSVLSNLSGRASPCMSNIDAAVTPGSVGGTTSRAEGVVHSTTVAIARLSERPA
eukprot:9942197-Heterocapsa_arctica.AAC.1